MKTYRFPSQRTFKFAFIVIIALTLGAIARYGHADPAADPALRFNQKTGAPIVATAPTAHAIATDPATIPTARAIQATVGDKGDGTIGKAQDRLTQKLQAQIKTEDTAALCHLFTNTNTQMIRLWIASELKGRTDLTADMVIGMAKTQSDHNRHYQTNQVLTELANMTFCKVGPELLASNLATMPHVIANEAIMVLVKSEKTVQTNILVTAALNLGPKLNLHVDLVDAISDREDCPTESTAMITALLLDTGASGKGQG